MTGYFAGLDVSDQTTAICLLDGRGKPVLETSVATTPAAIAGALKPYRRVLEIVGQEAGTKAAWLHKELTKRKFPVVCLDAYHTHAALAAQRNKTDKNDARGIANVLLRGAFSVSHVKSSDAQNVRLLLGHRRAMLRKAHDLRRSLITAAKLFGVELERRAGKLLLPRRGLSGDPMLEKVMRSIVRATDALEVEIKLLDEMVERLAERDRTCQRLMTVPGIGPLTALTFMAAVDDPRRFASSRNVAAYFGLTPRVFQSGQSSFSGRISRRGDRWVRSALFVSAMTLLINVRKECALRRWGLSLKERRGLKIAAIACARKLAVIMHRMWVTERDFQLSPDKPRDPASTTPAPRRRRKPVRYRH